MQLLIKYKLFFRVVSSCCSKSDCNAQTKACAEYLASYSTTQVRSCQSSSPGDNRSWRVSTSGDNKSWHVSTSGDNRSCQNSSHRNTSRCSSAKVGRNLFFVWCQVVNVNKILLAFLRFLCLVILSLYLLPFWLSYLSFYLVFCLSVAVLSVCVLSVCQSKDSLLFCLVFSHFLSVLLFCL